MPRFAANLTMMFNEHKFLDRFAAAADAGFSAVEYLFPYEVAPEAIARELQRHNLQQALFNCPPGDWAAGDRGLAALPERLDELKAGVASAIQYARATNCRRLHLMAGIADSRSAQARSAYLDAIRWTADMLASEKITLLLEPINSRDMPGYFLNDFSTAEQIIADVGMDNVQLQFDVYHRAIMHGDVTVALRRRLPLIGHVQVASVPSRNEPESEEIAYPFIFAELDRLAYDGFVGCEYRPASATAAGLGWFQSYPRNNQ